MLDLSPIRFFLPILLTALGFLFACSNPEVQFNDKLTEARTALSEGNPELALALLDPLNEQFPNRGVLLLEMGRAYEANGEDLFAALFYEQAAGLDANFSDKLFQSAKLYYRAGDSERGRRVLNEYLTRFPEDSEAWRFSGAQLKASRQLQSSLTAHLRAERLDGAVRNPEYAAEIGELYLALDNLAQAEAYFQTAIDESPDNRLQALMGMLATVYRAEDYARAERLIADLDQDFPGALDASAMAPAREQIRLWRISQDSLMAGLEAVSGTEEDMPDPVPSEEPDRGTTIIEEGEDVVSTVVDDSSEEEVSVISPGDVEAMADLGTQKTPGIVNGTEPELAVAAELPAADADTGGGKLAGLDLPDIEIEEDLPDLEIESPLPKTAEEKGRIAMEAGDPDRAVTYYWEAVQMDSDRADLWANLSAAYLAAGQPGNAETTILEALRRNPNDLQYTLSYLNVIQQTRTRGRLIEELEKAYGRIPNSPDIVLALARVYGEPEGNPDNAIYYYKEFLRMAPGHPEVASAREEMSYLP